jgi:uroporphyrinogen decarboxylase
MSGKSDKGLSGILHSDGNLWPLIPHFIEAGINCVQPLEVKAGMDVRELKRRFGDQLAFMGGINVTAMYDPDPRIIEEEIRSKFEVAKVGGGYIYHSDHAVPPNVSFERYERIMELVRNYGEY